ncbi:VWA domain-containing protein [Brucepastera parasyntrophica]|uniref:vWA domain-containing protein n=1 Tax=Brucepastera parasyntrophica TaxID=2880008 RepID=UPI002109F0EB|nr:vWA domain-containing protein [Brucepastera parasyntrophica]ULQ60596.1 VWA domain-containing protein [Brucepastera parasyntrophica]
MPGVCNDEKNGLALLLIPLFSIIFPVFAGERTIPVDMFLMIDKSLSMEEPGKFETMHTWVQEQLLGQMLIEGDWITLYSFYGKPDHLLTLTIAGEADRAKIIQVFNSIEPDGRFTDIGLALDTLKDALKQRGENDRYKIMLLLTDLRQEAPGHRGMPVSLIHLKALISHRRGL